MKSTVTLPLLLSLLVHAAAASVPAPYPGLVAGFDADALKGSPNANHGGGTNPAMVINIAGLDAATIHDLLFMARATTARMPTSAGR